MGTQRWCSYRLDDAGFRGYFINLLHRFLYDSKHFVAIGEINSSYISLASRFLLGSVKPAFLLPFFVSLVVCVMFCEIDQYANDAAMQCWRLIGSQQAEHT